MTNSIRKLIGLSAIAMVLAGCGSGGGSGTGVNSTLPPPPPPPPPPVAQIPFGVKADTTFATFGGDIEIRWNHSAKAYEIRFPGSASEQLAIATDAQNFQRHVGQSGIQFYVTKSDTQEFTALGGVYDNKGKTIGAYVFGIPTLPGQVPTSGFATYAATIHGPVNAYPENGGYNLSGDVELVFDFGAASLTGFMRPTVSDGWGISYDLGQYNFIDTVFSKGSVTFSGRFSVPGGGNSADSGFSGRFAGPSATEIMAEFHAPILDPYTEGWTKISGVWIGKRK